MPFDYNQDVIELSDADYAIWYMDAMENYKKYDGKVVKFLALVYNPDKLRKGVMVPGRFAMTCCIEDVTFIGFKCKYEDEGSIPHKSWITITARCMWSLQESTRERDRCFIRFPSSLPRSRRMSLYISHKS